VSTHVYRVPSHGDWVLVLGPLHKYNVFGHVWDASSDLTLNRDSEDMPVTFDPRPHIDGLPYDPEQDANEKRDIRKRYRQLEKLTGGTPQRVLRQIY